LTTFFNWGQFHQRFMRSFYVRKLRPQLFGAYVIGLYFTGARLLAQKAARKMSVKLTPGLEPYLSFLFKRIHIQSIFWGKVELEIFSFKEL
jgi:hypothetical protein